MPKHVFISRLRLHNSRKRNPGSCAQRLAWLAYIKSRTNKKKEEIFLQRSTTGLQRVSIPPTCARPKHCSMSYPDRAVITTIRIRGQLEFLAPILVATRQPVLHRYVCTGLK